MEIVGKHLHISIHALRVEGDSHSFRMRGKIRISIHALRVEGDRCHFSSSVSPFNFYPRPPGGGRLDGFAEVQKSLLISIHALRVEGDPDD